MLVRILVGIFTAIALTMSACAAPAAPSEIKIGTLYASSGAFAAISMPVYSGLKFWVDQKNAEGGVFVQPYHKKIPVKLIAYDDQSNTATAAALYNQLITQDKVNILVADSGSVLTSVAVPIAREHKMLLIDQTGTGASFFTKDNPYIVLTADPVSSIWPQYIADFLTKEGVKLGVKRIALLYATNDFTGTQAAAVRNFIKTSGAPVQIVYDQGVPTSTSNYTVLINNIKATNPDAVIELGFPNNDIAFLRNLQDSGVSFNFVFNIYSGLETDHLVATAGVKAMQYTYTYVTSSAIRYQPNFGMGLDAYRAAWEKKNANGKISFGSNAVSGYTTALVLEKALSTTDSLDQLALRKAIGEQRGKLKTLDGTFDIDETGAQIGEITPLGQVIPDGKGGVKFAVVYPPNVATGKARYPASE